MTPERWQQIEDLFARASDLATSERERFLADACGTDRELRLELESLLASGARASESLHDVVGAVATQLDGDRAGPGSVIADRFELDALAGTGGMGEVFRGRDRTTGEPVAIKILRRHDELERKRFVREARVLAELDHPAIVRRIADGETPGGELYLVMAWVDGTTLDQRLAKGALAVADAVALVRVLAEALTAVHAKGVVHRDVKPSNVILEGDDLTRPRLVDFGVARIANPTIPMTRTGYVLGTPSYMAPEQIRGEREIDARADVFALGCVLHECVTGKPAFAGPTARAVLAKVLFDEPPRLPDRPDLPAELGRLIASMLDKQATHRPQDAAEVVARLGRISFAPVPTGIERDTLPELPGFEVVRRIGRGGSSDVFEAVRVGAGGFRKPVALKQLADEGLAGKARERFFEEARLSAQLEHPNLVRVADVVTAGTRCFIVMDLLRGANLAEAADALRSWPIALSIAEQVLDGLGYAHAGAGDRPQLVHRDLTPRNVFACSDGSVKILDFGIAKRGDGPPLTTTGHIHGTLSFLSPEQARGERVDRRSDLYQLGATLYWLLSGTFPHGDAVAAGEIIARVATGRFAALRELVELPGKVSAVIERAMAIDPEARFATASEMRDAVTSALSEVSATDRGPTAIARALEGTPGPTAPATDRRAFERSSPERAITTRPRTRWPWLVAAAAAIGLVAGIVVARRDTSPIATPITPPAAFGAPRWTRLTFDAGALTNARFVPGRDSFVYSGQWESSRLSVREQAYTADRARIVADDAALLAASRDDLLVVLQPRRIGVYTLGTLAKIPLAGGGPRELATDVFAADISRDGSVIAATRWVKNRAWLEFPLGHQVAGPAAMYDTLRISPAGDRLAFVEVDEDDAAHERHRLVVLGRDGSRHVFGAPWRWVRELVWSPSGDELWISGSRTSSRAFDVFAVDAAGTERLVASSPDVSRLTDVDTNGRALVISERELDRVVGDVTGTGRERYLPTLYGHQPIVSQDLKWFMFMDNTHAMADGAIAIYRAPLDGSTAPVHFADGLPRYTTADGGWLLVASGRRDGLKLVPLGAGNPIEVPTGDLRDIASAVTLAGNHTVIATARRGTEPPRLYRIDLDGNVAPRPLGPPGIRLPEEIQVVDLQSPDGAHLLVVDDASSTYRVMKIADGTVRSIPGFQPGWNCGWRPDGTLLVWVIVTERGTEIYEHDPETGKHTLLRTMPPLDSTGDATSMLVWMSRDLTRYIKWETQRHAFLYRVDGLH